MSIHKVELDNQAEFEQLTAKLTAAKVMYLHEGNTLYVEAKHLRHINRSPEELPTATRQELNAAKIVPAPTSTADSLLYALVFVGVIVLLGSWLWRGCTRALEPTPVAEMTAEEKQKHFEFEFSHRGGWAYGFQEAYLKRLVHNPQSLELESSQVWMWNDAPDSLHVLITFSSVNDFNVRKEGRVAATVGPEGEVIRITNVEFQ